MIDNPAREYAVRCKRAGRRCGSGHLERYLSPPWRAVDAVCALRCVRFHHDGDGDGVACGVAAAFAEAAAAAFGQLGSGKTVLQPGP